MDHDHALTKLDVVPESEGKPPGEFFAAGEGLDSWVSPTPALLLSLQTNEQLRKGEEKHMSILQTAIAGVWLKLISMVCMEQLYLLQTEHQCTSALYLIDLSGPVHCLLDDVSKVIIVLRTKREN